MRPFFGIADRAATTNKAGMEKVKRRCGACRGTGSRFSKRPIATICGKCFGRGWSFAAKFGRSGSWFD